MNKIYENFFRKLLDHEDTLEEYVDSLYTGMEFSNNDLNQIFTALKNEGLVACEYYDNRAWIQEITFMGSHYFDDAGSAVQEPRLIKLIEEADEVEKAFHSGDRNQGLFDVAVIHDTQVFQDWIQELQYELQELFKTCKDEYIKKTIAMVAHPFNGWNDHNDFVAIKGRLRVIKRNQDKYFSISAEKENNRITMEKMLVKKPLVFISHSSQNKEQVKMFAELLRSLNLVPMQDIFCSSLPGYDIPIDTDANSASTACVFR